MPRDASTTPSPPPASTAARCWSPSTASRPMAFARSSSIARATASRCTRCRSRQLHHLEGRAADEAGGVGEGRDHLEVVEPFADEIAIETADGVHRGSELARLALELGAVVVAVGDDHRTGEAREVTL